MDVKFGMWVPADILPEPGADGDFAAWQESDRILITDGREVWTGYCMLWEPDTEDPCAPEVEWRIAGPDWYKLHGCTAWMPLPDIPAWAQKREVEK